MYSVLEFLKETEPLLKYENHSDVMYVVPCVNRLKQNRERLRTYFYEHESDDAEGLKSLFMQCNATALQLELHLSRTEDDFYEKHKKRLEAEEICNKITALMKDAQMTDKLTDNQIIELVQISNFVKRYWTGSKFYVWNPDDKDKQKLKQAKSFMEVYNGIRSYIERPAGSSVADTE